MCKKIIAAILVLLMGLSFANIYAVKADDLEQKPTVTSFVGTVKVKKSGGLQEYSVYDRMPVEAPDTIITGEGSSVTIAYGQKEIIIGANSMIVFNEVWNRNDRDVSSVHIVEGSIKNKVKKTLNKNSRNTVQGANMIAGVRGTEFIMGYSRNVSEEMLGLENPYISIVVLSGTVRLDVDQQSFSSEIPAEAYLANREGIERLEESLSGKTSVADVSGDRLYEMLPSAIDARILEAIANDPDVLKENIRYFGDIEELIRERYEYEQKVQVAENIKEESKTNDFVIYSSEADQVLPTLSATSEEKLPELNAAEAIVPDPVIDVADGNKETIIAGSDENVSVPGESNNQEVGDNNIESPQDGEIGTDDQEDADADVLEETEEGKTGEDGDSQSSIPSQNSDDKDKSENEVGIDDTNLGDSIGSGGNSSSSGGGAGSSEEADFRVSIVNADIQIHSTHIYDGNQQIPDITITRNNRVLRENVDYICTVSNHVNAGTAFIELQGIGNYYGTRNTTFSIDKRDISNATISKIDDLVYSGNELKPAVVVTDMKGSENIIKTADYDIEYSNNINKGSAEVKLTGTGNYAGTLSHSFNILEAEQAMLSHTLNSTTFTYGDSDFRLGVTGGAAGATISYSVDKAEVVSVDENGNVSIQNTGSVIITAKSTKENYQNITLDIPISIGRKDLSKVSISEIDDQVYSGKELKPAVVVTDMLGSKNIIKTTDYDIGYSNNINKGIAEVKLTGTGNYVGTLLHSFNILEAEQAMLSHNLSSTTFTYGDSDFSLGITGTAADAAISYSVDKAGVVSVDENGEVTIQNAGSVVITAKSAKENYQDRFLDIPITVEKRSFTNIIVNEIEDVIYIGKELKPKIEVSDAKGTEDLLKSTDYEVTYTDNVDAGTASMVITASADGNYSGDAKKVNFTICPKEITATIENPMILSPIEDTIDVRVKLNGVIGDDDVEVKLTTDAAYVTYAQGKLEYSHAPASVIHSLKADCLDSNYVITGNDVFEFYVYDGSNEDKSIPVSQDTIASFNVYANTSAGASKWYHVAESINLSTVPWTPVGSTAVSFSGVFDGREKVISNLLIDNQSGSNQGFFGYVDGGMIQNISLTNLTINGNSSIGGIAGYVNSGTVQGCTVDGNINGDSTIGGIVGDLAQYGIGSAGISNCTSNVIIRASGNYVGGIAGNVLNVMITNCESQGSIYAGDYVGGIAGQISVDSIVSGCTSSMFVGGEEIVNYKDGIVGNKNGGTVTEDCIFTGRFPWSPWEPNYLIFDGVNPDEVEDETDDEIDNETDNEVEEDETDESIAELE